MKTNKKISFLIALFIISFVFFSLARVVLAYQLTTPLPCVNSGFATLGTCPLNTQAASDIGAYIIRVYQFAVGIAGILAVGMIVAGAIYISVSGDSPDKRSEGRSMIVSAIWGLVLLFGSFIILNTINPQLTILTKQSLQNLPPAPISTYSLPSGTNACPNPNDTSCFFNPSLPSSTATCSTSANNLTCTALDTSTPTCKGQDSQGPSPNLPCVCLGCQRLDPAVVPIKSTDTCAQSGSVSGMCFLEATTKSDLLQFISTANDAGYTTQGWRVTEAFPPYARHGEKCHYNGTCFDYSSQAAMDSAFCDNTLNLAKMATNYFNQVLIEGLAPTDCPNIPNTYSTVTGVTILRATYATTEGFHIHIADPK